MSVTISKQAKRELHHRPPGGLGFFLGSDEALRIASATLRDAPPIRPIKPLQADRQGVQDLSDAYRKRYAIRSQGQKTLRVRSLHVHPSPLAVAGKDRLAQ